MGVVGGGALEGEQQRRRDGGGFGFFFAGFFFLSCCCVFVFSIFQVPFVRVGMRLLFFRDGDPTFIKTGGRERARQSDSTRKRLL